MDLVIVENGMNYLLGQYEKIKEVECRPEYAELDFLITHVCSPQVVTIQNDQVICIHLDTCDYESSGNLDIIFFDPENGLTNLVDYLDQLLENNRQRKIEKAKPFIL